MPRQKTEKLFHCGYIVLNHYVATTQQEAIDAHWDYLMDYKHFPDSMKKDWKKDNIKATRLRKVDGRLINLTLDEK